MRLRSQTLQRMTPKVDAQYHIGVPPLDDLDRPQPRVVAPHANPGDRFYNPDPIARSNPGSRGSSTEPMDTDEGQQTTNRLVQAIRESVRLRRSGLLGETPSAPFQFPVAGTTPLAAAAASASNTGVMPAISQISAAAPETRRRLVGMSNRMINTPGEPTQREADGISLLSIPPYASQEGVEGEKPTLHRLEVVEPPDIFQRSGEKGARPKERARYNTRTMREERDHQSYGERHPFEIRTDFYLPLPGQPRITELHSWRTPICTEQGNEGIYVRIDEWKDTYGTNV